MGLSKKQQIRDLEAKVSALEDRLESAQRYEKHLTDERADAVEVVGWLAKKAGIYETYAEEFEKSEKDYYESFTNYVLTSMLYGDLEKAKKHNETLEALERTSKARATGGKK